jgi:hypothetical protein
MCLHVLQLHTDTVRVCCTKCVCMQPLAEVCHLVYLPMYIPSRYVEELDLLALALGGAFKQRSMPLQCRGGAA